jgi:hypothetical protein
LVGFGVWCVVVFGGGGLGREREVFFDNQEVTEGW